MWDGRVLAVRFREQEIRLSDPERQHHLRQRTRWALGSLASVNLLVLLWAVASAPVFSPTGEATTPLDQAASPRRAVSHARAIQELSPTVPESCGTATIRGVERLVLRAAPGFQTETLADYPVGTEVLLSCAEPVTADGLIWQPVQIDERAGWMSQRMLQLTR